MKWKSVGPLIKNQIIIRGSNCSEEISRWGVLLEKAKSLTKLKRKYILGTLKGEKKLGNECSLDKEELQDDSRTKQLLIEKISASSNFCSF